MTTDELGYFSNPNRQHSEISFQPHHASWSQGMTPQMPVRPQPSRPIPPQQPRPEPIRPQPSRPQPIRPPHQPSRPPHHGPNRPQGMTSQMPVLPNAPRPPRPTRPHSLPMGFPLLAQARIGIVFTGFGRIPMHSLPLFFSPVIDRIPHNTFVWVFGERNGWSAVHYDGRIGFVDSRFVILL